MAADEATGRAFVGAFDDTPVVLMSEGGDEGDVMRSVTLGAVDFMDKPLSALKLKNIWQHSVRRMMQRTSLYDSSCAPGQAVSEPAHRRALALPSISDALPSSMTAPIGAAPPPLPKLATLPPSASQPHRSSVDSPGTPSANDADLQDSASADSTARRASSLCGQEGRTARISTDGGRLSLDADMEEEEDHDDLCSLEPAAKRAHTAHPRAPLACKPSSFGPLMPVAPVSQWPRLPAGCAWGTPLGGPLPPPLPAWAAPAPAPAAPPMAAAMRESLAPAPVLIRAGGAAPAPAAPCAAPLSAPADLGALPEGFLASLVGCGGGGGAMGGAEAAAGPLGLKLRKSGSLLDLVNSTLATRA